MVEKEYLVELVSRGLTKRQVSKELGIGYSTVYKYMSKYNFVNSLPQLIVSLDMPRLIQ